MASLVAASLLVGFVLQPAFGRDAYAAFYPVAPLCAWMMGPKPALAATALSAVVAFICLGPGLGAPDAAGLAALGGFLAVSGAGVAVIAGLTSGLSRTRRPEPRLATPPRKSERLAPPSPAMLESEPVTIAAERERRRAIG